MKRKVARRAIRRNHGVGQKFKKKIQVRGVSKRVSMKPETKHCFYYSDSGLITTMNHEGTNAAPMNPFRFWALTSPGSTGTEYFTPLNLISGGGVGNVYGAVSASGVIGSQLVLLYCDLRFKIRLNPTQAQVTNTWTDNFQQVRVMIVTPKNNETFNITNNTDNKCDLLVDRYFHSPANIKYFHVHYDKVFDCGLSANFSAGTAYVGTQQTTQRQFRIIIPAKQVLTYSINPAIGNEWVAKNNVFAYVWARYPNTNWWITDLLATYYYKDP